MTDDADPDSGWFPDQRSEPSRWDDEQTFPTTLPHGPASPDRKPWKRKWLVWSAIASVTILGIGAIANATILGPANDSTETSSAKVPALVPEASSEPTRSPGATTLLFITDQKDGDSWVASDGKEYRLGLINTPESNEQCGPEAAAFTRAFVSDGFTADAYTKDTHGRTVAEVFNHDGDSLNVALAASGLGNDRYLDEFRHENPDLGVRLDSALASAAAPECGEEVAPVPLVSKTKTPAPAKNCMAGYSPCLPVVGDLDCGEIGHSVKVTGSDPYRLDRDGDGIGCD